MKNKTVVPRKLLYAALLGATCIAPLIGSISPAQADSHSLSNNHHEYQTFVGHVTKIDSSSEFNMRFNNKMYNVYVSGQLPNRLHKYDKVSVYGYLHGHNDIRDATVTVVHDH